MFGVDFFDKLKQEGISVFADDKLREPSVVYTEQPLPLGLIDELEVLPINRPAMLALSKAIMSDSALVLYNHQKSECRIL